MSREQIESLANEFLSNTSQLPEEYQDWRAEFARDLRLVAMTHELSHPEAASSTGRGEDGFNGDNAKLVGSINALLRLDAAGALVPHGIGGHARTLLTASAARLATPPPGASRAVDEAVVKALKWALLLAKLAIENVRMERVKCGHHDIRGTYKGGETWVGIYQSEIDEIAAAEAALTDAQGERGVGDGV